MREVVLQTLSARSNMEAVALSDGATLDQLGVDSIDLALVFAQAEKEFELDFDNEEVSVLRYATLGDLIRAIEHRVGSAA